jgi:hypothetical protein
MILVDMSIPNDVDELSSLKSADLSNHACEERVAGNVKGHS